MDDFTIREIDGFDEIHACVELQRATWGMPDVDLTPARLFVVAKWGGTPPLGAFDRAGRLVAFLHTLLANYDGTPAFYSHMLAVVPELRDAGLGYLLKLEQRRRALEMGVALVVWTFDPLQSRNAYFNLNKLGAVVRRYARNFYGEHHASVFDAGLGSDRLFAEWWVGSEHVARVLGGEHVALGPEAGRLEPGVEIPDDINTIKRTSHDEAVAWRTRTREAFEAKLAEGAEAVALERDRERGVSRYLFGTAGDAR